MKKIILLISVALLILSVPGVEAGELKKPSKSMIVKNAAYYCKVKVAHDIEYYSVYGSYDSRRYYESLDPKTIKTEEHSHQVGRYDSRKDRWPVKFNCVVHVDDYSGGIHRENVEIKVYYHQGEFEDYGITLPGYLYDYSKVYRAKYGAK